MAIPTYASEYILKQGIPMYHEGKDCKSERDFGAMTFIIGGKQYTLENYEWMFPRSTETTKTSLV
jgi:hypothetical protein